MALPTRDDLKSYLKIEIDAENALLDALLVQGKAMVEVWIGAPITAVQRTYVDRAVAGRDGFVDGEVATALIVPVRPIGSTPENPVVVTDGAGVVVPSTDYEVDTAAGMLWGKNGKRFPNGPYSITCLVGLSLWQKYAQVEPVLSRAILDVAADLYQNRTPRAMSETGAGVAIPWDVSRHTSERVIRSLKGLTLPVVA
ncbi:MAG: phage gp6-like head-tail connector protein [Burkholderiales bacterium]|nr:phage gp6-like head-tail connector protein [Burkholderiales bacterium]